MKLKVMVINGIVDGILIDKEALDLDLNIQVIDYNNEKGNKDLLVNHYKDENLRYAVYSVDRCIEKAENKDEINNENKDSEVE